MIKKMFLALTVIALNLFSHSALAQENGVIIEWAPFSVVEGVSDEALIEMSQRLQSEFLEKQHGFIKRDLLKSPDGGWVDLVYWASEEDAQLAMKNSMESAICGEYFGLMVMDEHAEPGAGVLHFTKKAGWE